MKSILISSAIILVSCSCFSQQPQQNNYPADSRIGWVNVKSYGAKGDGVTDDTKAIQKAITTYPYQYQTVINVYFPDGIYIVSDTLKYLNGYWDFGVTLQGQSTNGTIIRLKDNAPGYNDPSNPKPVIYTRAGNQSFKQYIFNMTINTGKNNAGAVAIDYITNNNGAIKDVKIISEDKKGYCGLLMERGWPGPGLIKNVRITGFDYGIRMGTPEYSMTFENLTLDNQNKCGFINSGNIAAMRLLTSNNVVPVIENTDGGMVVLLDGNFINGAADTSSIIHKSGAIYLRNIKTTGYKSVLKNGNEVISGTSISEYSSQQPNTLFNTTMLSINLPVKETPEYVNNDTLQWANVQDYGAYPMDILYGFFDATNGIRKAMYSGKPIIYFPPSGSNGSSYHIYDTITIPSSVKLIIGFNHASISSHNNARLIVQQNSADPLLFERMAFIPLVYNKSLRSIVFKYMGIHNYMNDPNTGDVFIEDVTGKFTPQNAVNLWARQFNPELQSNRDTNLFNSGGNHWILGLKTEGKARISRTLNGGYTEILGGLAYPATSFAAEDTLAAFESVDACISAMMAASSYLFDGFYTNLISETRKGITNKLFSNNLRSRNIFYAGGCSAVTGTHSLPQEKAQLSVYPNPSNGLVFIRYQLAENSNVKVSVCDLLGKEVMHVVCGNQAAGEHSQTINLENVQNGIYFVRLRINGNYTPTKKFIVNKPG